MKGGEDFWRVEEPGKEKRGRGREKEKKKKTNKKEIYYYKIYTGKKVLFDQSQSQRNIRCFL